MARTIVEVTETYRAWYKALSFKDQARVDAVVSQLVLEGPGMRRPLVGHVVGSQHQNMRELIIGQMRILFSFAPNGHAVLLVGGSKYKTWQSW